MPFFGPRIRGFKKGSTYRMLLTMDFAAQWASSNEIFALGIFFFFFVPHVLFEDFLPTIMFKASESIVYGVCLHLSRPLHRRSSSNAFECLDASFPFWHHHDARSEVSGKVCFPTHLRLCLSTIRSSTPRRTSLRPDRCRRSGNVFPRSTYVWFEQPTQ